MSGVKFEEIKAESVKIGEMGLMEVVLKRAVDGEKVSEFLCLDRSYQDINGEAHKKGSITMPKAVVAQVADAMKRLVG